MATTLQPDRRTAPDGPGPAAEPVPRWSLSRAGIVNVYQYGNETLHFGGGRLLLRGVNGSGKSTAMNMLLPFLLDAQTRRIDAAGEQSGVLRSWMLSGRDEAQPQGAARAIVCEWPEPWAREWIDDVIRAGILRDFDRERTRTLLRQVRDVLDDLGQDRPRPVSRVDLAARVLGSAHALDTGTRVEAAVARALAFRIGPGDHRDLSSRIRGSSRPRRRDRLRGR